MLTLARRALVPAVVVGWLLAGAPARAAVPEVRDDAKFFKADTIKRVNAIIREIHDKYQRDLFIETYPTPPGGEAEAAKVKAMDKNRREEFYSNWLRERARDLRVDGVYVVITRNPPEVEVGVGGETRKRDFTSDNRRELQRLMVDRFKKKEFDDGLVAAAEYVRDSMRSHHVAASPQTPTKTTTAPAPSPSVPVGQRPVEHHDAGAAGWLGGLGGLLCLAVVAILVIWLVVGLIRAFTGGGRSYGGPGGYAGGGGYGPGYGPGYGGGGGGFMSGVLGGLFGAAAGSWMYDRFFRGDTGHNSGGNWGAGSAYGAGAEPAAPGHVSDEGRDFETGGGDFGGDAGAPGGGGATSTAPHALARPAPLRE